MKDARDEEDPRLCEPVRKGPFWTVDCHDSAPLRHFRSRRRAQGPDAVAFFCEADSSSSFPRNPLRTRRRAGVGNAPRGKVPFITVDGVKVADSDLVIGFLKTAFPDPDAGLSDHQRAVGHLVQRTLEDHLYWIALIYEFYDQEGSDWFFEHAFGGIGPGLQGLRD